MSTPPPSPDLDSLLATWETPPLDLGARAPGSAEAATAILLAPGPEGPADPRLLLILRARRPGDPWSGQVGLPGGRRDAEDPDRVATALRETSEEVGLSIPRTRLIGGLEPIQARRRGARLDLMVHPFVFRLDEAPAPGTSDEVAEARWVPLAHLLDPARGTSLPIETPGGTRSFPAVALDGWTLWGLTYRMLTDLAGRVGRTLAGGPLA